MGPPKSGHLETGAGALLERDQSMSVLEGSLTSVRSTSQARLVLVRGEAGVGKSTLLRTFCARQGKTVRVLWGACAPLQTPRPLGPLLDVAEATRGELAELVVGGARPHEVSSALVRELGAGVVTVLVLEDLHWADEATLDVLTLLATRIGSVPALVLASYRDDELDRAHPLRIALGELGRTSVRLKVEPLSQATVIDVAERYGVDGIELHRMTGGNPFFVTEVLAAGGEEIPETVRDSVLARAARLAGPARRLLDAVAVVPGQVELWLLEALAGELIDELEACVASGVLRQGPLHVAFRHELARIAVDEATPPNRRVALHRAALAALEARGGEDPELARLADHAEAASDRDSVLRWAPRAAEHAARSGSHREAAAQYARALRFAEGCSPEMRAELFERRVDECWMTDQLPAAIDAQREALTCWRRLGDERREGDALRTLSRLLFFTGQVREGEEAAVRAIELLEAVPAGHELAMAYANLSQRRMVLEDFDEAIAWGNRAVKLARDLDDQEAQVYALTNMGAAEFEPASEDGRVKLEQALALAQRHGLDDYAGRAYYTIVRSAVRCREFTLAEDYLEPGLEYCRERGLDTWRLYLLSALARLEFYRGRWDEAADAAKLVLRDPRSAALPRGVALTTLGSVRLRRGDPDSSAPLNEERALAWATDEVDRIGVVEAALAEAAWLAGDTASIEQETDAALALALQRQTRWVVGELACWRWRAGVEDQLPSAAAAEPYALSLAGEPDRAAEMWREIGCPYESALALADRDDEGALRQAADELRAVGARPAVEIVMRRLHARGVRGLPRGPRPRTRENPGGLTARELEVLALLVEGLRNAQIAERLVVSEKTVGHHVSAILRKFGVRNRGEAAAEARRLELT